MSNQYTALPWPARFWEKTEQQENGCLLWTGAVGTYGYGKVWIPGRKVVIESHRVAYELSVGAIPPGLHIDHLCRTPTCVNPDHLEPVTVAENQRRGLKGILRTQCRNGHPYNEDNTTYLDNGHRICRACSRAAAVRYRARKIKGES